MNKAGVNPMVSPVVRVGLPAQGGPRRQTQTELLFHNDVSGSNPNQPFYYFVVRTPSTRLITTLWVTYRPKDTEDIATPFFTTGFFLQLDAWVRASSERGGFLMRGNNIITNALLPFGLNEPLQGVDEIRGIVTVPFPTGMVVGDCYVTATWEPAPGESSMPDDELRKLFGVATLITNGGSTFGNSE